MPVEETEIVFTGSDGAEAERFINRLRRIARAEGKLRDKEWMLDLALTCLEGDALRWHSRLPREVRNDWDALEDALLEKYPPSSPTGEPNRRSSFEPTPAGTPTSAAGAAPAPAPAPISELTRSFIQLNLGPQTGLVKVVADDPSVSGYLARSMDPQYSIMVTCTNAADALRIQFWPASYPHGIEILNSATRLTWMGATHWDNSDVSAQLGKGSRASAALTTTSSPTSTPTSSYVGAKGPTKSGIWNVSPFDGSITASWDADGCSYNLQLVAIISKKHLFLVSNYEAYCASRPKGTRCKARMIFEPA
ncbi:hypothetical protein FRC04_007298 [Tulasnella sp. 424]|nr:hypothetical protein FRC04_007298 [Tulasnella sp. 424]